MNTKWIAASLKSVNEKLESGCRYRATVRQTGSVGRVTIEKIIVPVSISSALGFSFVDRDENETSYARPSVDGGVKDLETGKAMATRRASWISEWTAIQGGVSAILVAK